MSALPSHSGSIPCPCCEGAGCAECSNTGQRVTTHLDAGDGMTMRVSGNAPLSPETQAALLAVGRAAYARLREERDA